ncbi:RNA polymerase sigma factor [Rhodovibrionaceae bacterium A322]
MRNDQEQAKNLSARTEKPDGVNSNGHSVSPDSEGPQTQDSKLGPKVVDLRQAFAARRSARQPRPDRDLPEQAQPPHEKSGQDAADISTSNRSTPDQSRKADPADQVQTDNPIDMDGLTRNLQQDSTPPASAVEQHPISRLSPDAAVKALLAGTSDDQQVGARRRDQIPLPEQPALDPDNGSGPAALFWDVWQSHQAHLQRQSLRLMSGNRADAEDALSTAMLRASQKYAHYAETIINQRAWLTRLLHNACMDHYRGQARRNRLVGDQKEEAAEIGHPSLAAEPEHSPEDIALNREALRAVERQVEGLPPNLRLPFLMRFVQDHSYNEIASHLELTNCAVRKRIQLARERLRQNLDL